MNRIGRATRDLLACIGFIASHPAQANSANTSVVTGSASAVVSAPIRLVAVTSLQFGAIAQPQVGGTLTVSPSGTVSTTGDLGNASAIAQPTPPAAASFNVTGLAGTLFTATGVSQVTISNGSAKMTVGQFTINGAFSGGQIGTNGTTTFNIGGTLTVAPGQAIGNYTGTFPITVAYY
jgi:hypothetical protein